MKIFKLIFLLVILLVTIVSPATAEPVKPPAFTEKGILVGYGGDNWSQTTIGPDSYRGDYQTVMVAGHFTADLSRIFPDFKNIPGVLSFYLEPTYDQGINGGYEAWLNMGLFYRVPVSDRFDGYLGLGGGPAYLSTLQANNPPGNGWCIAGTVSFGTYYHLQDDSAINLGLRLKHDSNGRLDWPIHIYNDWSVIAGYSWFYD